MCDTSNGSDAVLNWTAVTTAGTVPPFDASLKNMAFYINGSNLILGTILSISGKIYSFRQITSGSFNLFAIATACNFTDLKYNGGFFYSFDNIGKQLYRIYVPNTGNPTAMLILGVNTSVVSPASLDFTSANSITID